MHGAVNGVCGDDRAMGQLWCLLVTSHLGGRERQRVLSLRSSLVAPETLFLKNQGPLDTHFPVEVIFL